MKLIFGYLLKYEFKISSDHLPPKFKKMMTPIISLIVVLCRAVANEGSSGPLNIQSSSLNEEGRQVKKSIVTAESGEDEPVARPVTPPTLVAPLQQAKVLIIIYFRYLSYFLSETNYRAKS